MFDVSGRCTIDTCASAFGVPPGGFSKVPTELQLNENDAGEMGELKKFDNALGNIVPFAVALVPLLKN
jgi:hypothetical protein